MIDYEKLKLAHELANKYADLNHESCTITEIYYGTSKEKIYKLNTYSHPEFFYRDIDDLIIKLQELTMPKPKYEIGQQVYFISTEGYIAHEMIDDVDSVAEEKYFINEERWFREDEIFPSRKALIDAQIEYWTSLKTEGKSTCSDDVSMPPSFECEIKGFNHSEGKLEKVGEHESDGGPYVVLNKCTHLMDWKKSFYPQKKCKKCGDFYR